MAQWEMFSWEAIRELGLLCKLCHLEGTREKKKRSGFTSHSHSWACWQTQIWVQENRQLSYTWERQIANTVRANAGRGLSVTTKAQTEKQQVNPPVEFQFQDIRTCGYLQILFKVLTMYYSCCTVYYWDSIGVKALIWVLWDCQQIWSGLRCI